MKKIFGLMAAAVVCTSSVMSVGATNVTPSSEIPSGNTTVTATVSPTYTVTIPSEAKLTAQLDGTLSAESEITVSAVKLRKGYKLSVTVESANDFVMTSDDDAELAYALACGENEVDSENSFVAEFVTSTEQQSAQLSFTADEPEFAGEFTDVLTFTISQVEE